MTIYKLLVRSLLFRRRSLALAALAAVPALVTIGVVAGGGPNDADAFAARLVERIMVPTIGAFVALVLGASALGDERDEGTIVYLHATPIARRTIVLAAIAAATTAALALLLPTLVVSLVVAGRDAPRALTVFALAIVLSTLAYCAAFVWLSLRARRPVVIGALYILLWEGSIAGFARSADRLSIGAYGRAIAARAIPEAPRFNVPSVAPVAAGIVLLVAATALWLLGGRALERAELP